MSPPGCTIGAIGAIGDGTIGAIGEVLSDYRRLSEYYRSSLSDYRTGAQACLLQQRGSSGHPSRGHLQYLTKASCFRMLSRLASSTSTHLVLHLRDLRSGDVRGGWDPIRGVSSSRAQHGTPREARSSWRSASETRGAMRGVGYARMRDSTKTPTARQARMQR